MVVSEIYVYIPITSAVGKIAGEKRKVWMHEVIAKPNKTALL